MLPPLYLADTCSLRDAQMRDYWEREFFTQTDRKLTVLSTVHYELERQKLRPEHREEAKAALAFLNKHQSRVIFLPEQAEIPKGSVADREIFYHCALQQNREVVLFTADAHLRQAVLLINPLVQVQRLIKGQLKCEPSRWLSVYRRLAEQYCLYVTAACINSAAFAALMRSPEIASLFRGKLRLSTASLPLLKAQGKELLKTLETQGLAPLLVPQACFDVTETAELTARLLTHCGRKPALVLLADGDNLSDYTELSRIPLPALNHKGYSIGVLKGNGRISVQMEPTETPEPAEEETPEPAESESVADSPAESAAVEEPQTSGEPELPDVQAEEGRQEAAEAPAVNMKELVRQGVLAEKTTKVGAMISGNESLIRHAINTCFKEKRAMLGSIVQSLSQRKNHLPPKCFAAFVGTYMPTKPAELNRYFNDKPFVSAVKRMIGLCTSLKECQTAMDTLQKRIAETDGATQKVLKTLMDSAIANGAPRPQREN